MNKTVYLRDEEAQIWEKARELSGDKLSPVIVAALKEFIKKTESEKKRFERIVVEYKDADDSGLNKKKAFYGRWIVSPEDPYKAVGDDTRYSASIAETAKGNIVIYERSDGIDHHGDEWMQEKFVIFDSLSTAAKGEFRYAAVEANRRRGVPVEELDI
jgi:hypothetical protein